MTDETGKNDETKPATEAAPKPSRRQIAILGAAAPVLLTLPIRGARAGGGGWGGGWGGGDHYDESGDRTCGVCNASTFSADPDYQDKTEYKIVYKDGKKYKYTYNYHFSCIGDDVIEHKTLVSKQRIYG